MTTNKSSGNQPYLVPVSGRRQLHIRDGKKRISTGETERGAATAVLIDYIAKKGRLAEIEAEKSSAAATLSDIIAIWSENRQAKNMVTWRKKWCYHAACLLKRAGDTPLHSIDDDWAAQYERTRLLQDGVLEPTVRQELQTILAAWRMGLKARPKVTTLPVPDFNLPPASEPHDIFLTREEAERLIDAAKSDYMRLFIRLGFATAGRHEAILQLTWDRVDLNTGIIDLRLNKSELRPDSPRDKRGRRIRPPKQKPRAQVKVAGIVLDELKEARGRAVTDHVIEYKGRTLKKLNHGFNKVVEEAGLGGRGVTPNIMRHSAITWLMQGGKHPAQVAEFAGHKNTKMIFERYAHHHPDFQDDIANFLTQDP